MGGHIVRRMILRRYLRWERRAIKISAELVKPSNNHRREGSSPTKFDPRNSFSSIAYGHLYSCVICMKFNILSIELSTP